jgi:hypothetical protein
MDGLSYSGSEASKLSTLCEVIGYLAHNPAGDNKLPEDIESCFRRPVYWKWKTIAPKIQQCIDAYNVIPIGDGTRESEREMLDAEEEILDEIEGLIDLVYDEDLTHQEVTQQSRKTALRLKP